MSLLFALAAAAPADDEIADGWRAVALPIVSLNVDEGLGLGAVGALHRREDGRLRDDVSLRVFATSRLVQRHELRWDGIDAFDLPVRIWARAGLFSTLTQTYCGVGPTVTCDPSVAEEAAESLGLREGTDAFDEEVRRYYFMRFIRPFGELLLRWRVVEGPIDVELTSAWRGAMYVPGSFVDAGPYPHSLYAAAHPDGEPGFSSALQLGVTLDTRDDEVSPTRGWFVDTSIRGASPLLGSAWQNLGVNGSAALYTPLPSGPVDELVLAQRVLLDVLWGDVPVDELAMTGGVRPQAAFGGQWIGRGIRDHRYIGKVKAIHQIELRAGFFSHRVFDWLVDVGGTVFLDSGLIAADVDALQPRILYGGGLGLRLVFDRAIPLRLDVAASPFEETIPSFYTPVGGAF